jgi:hypothetical protein
LVGIAFYAKTYRPVCFSYSVLSARQGVFNHGGRRIRRRATKGDRETAILLYLFLPAPEKQWRRNIE